MNFTAAAYSDAADYRVLVTNPEGNDLSGIGTLTVVGPTVPILGEPVYSGGSVSFTVTSVPGFNQVVQGSTDFVTWVSLQTNTAPFVFTDPTAGSYSNRFYRAFYLP